MTELVWRWRTLRNPWPGRERIPHPLAARVGTRCRLLAQGRNGNRLVEFEDGFRTVAPLYATHAAATTEEES